MGQVCACTCNGSPGSTEVSQDNGSEEVVKQFVVQGDFKPDALPYATSSTVQEQNHSPSCDQKCDTGTGIEASAASDTSTQERDTGSDVVPMVEVSVAHATSIWSVEVEPGTPTSPLSPFKNAESSQDAYLRETLQMARNDPAPLDAVQAKTLGWRDISKSSATVFFRSTSSSKTTTDSVAMIVKTQDQVESLPLLSMQNGKIQSGAIPTLWGVEFWNLWFPFCDSCQILRRFSPACFIAIVKMKVLFLHVDFIAFFSIEDKLASDGCVELVLRSPPPGSEGKEWMGIVVPPKSGILPRVCVNFAVVKSTPITLDKVHIQGQIDVDDPAGAPSWIKVFFFQQLSVRMVPEIYKFQKKFKGSPLEKFLNGESDPCADAASLEFIRSIHSNICACVEKKEVSLGNEA